MGASKRLQDNEKFVKFTIKQMEYYYELCKKKYSIEAIDGFFKRYCLIFLNASKRLQEKRKLYIYFKNREFPSSQFIIKQFMDYKVMVLLLPYDKNFAFVL